MIKKGFRRKRKVKSLEEQIAQHNEFMKGRQMNENGREDFEKLLVAAVKKK